MMTDSNEWYEEPSSWHYVFTPAFLTSFAVTIILPTILSPLVCGTYFPKSKKILEKQRMHFHTLLSSTLHAVVVSVLSVYLLVSGSMEPDRVFSKLPLGFTTMQISYGYFIGDFIVCLLDPVLRNDKGSILHHLAGILSITLGLFYQGKLMFYIVYRLVSELSTPFVNLRWFHYHLGNKKGFCYLFASLGMMISFFLFRIVSIPWHWYALIHTLMELECAIVVELPWRVWIVAVYLLFDCLNMYWFSKMIKGAWKIFSNREKLDA